MTCLNVLIRMILPLNPSTMEVLRTEAALQWWLTRVGGELQVVDFQNLMGLRLVTIGMGYVCFDESITQEELFSF